MTWAKWVLFLIELVVRLSPIIRRIARAIIESIEEDARNEPMTSVQKRDLFETRFCRKVVAKTGNMPNFTKVSYAREWTLQRKDRQWRCPEPFASEVKLDKFYG